jgi:NTP pyrophosphatase (non-canonical NTP hydrolase)
MKYYLYHIPGKKIGVTRDLKKRVTRQQGYEPHEYEILYTYNEDEIEEVSLMEAYLQKKYGYRVDEVPYNKLKFNKEENDMNINVTEQTTTFPCPISKLKGQLMDDIGFKWKTEHGECMITSNSIDWIMANVQTSKYNNERCYVYNKAFSRWFDNNDAYATGVLKSKKDPCEQQDCGDCDCETKPMFNEQFDLIRDWARERGLYDKGDPKTQALKLVEEVGETCRAILKQDKKEIVDGIGDCVVVLVNLAELTGTPIEDCIAAAYNEIFTRTGKMVNGTFKKD